MQLVDDAGLVLPKRQTQLCTKHQRKVARVLSRSIAMGVLDWKEGTLKYLNPFQPELYPGEVATPTDITKSGTYSK